MDAFSILMKTGNAIGNLFFLIFGGFLIALEYFAAGLLLCITIVGIPFGYQCMKIGISMLAPFVLQYESTDKQLAVGCISTLFNVIWIFTFGLILVIEHALCGILLSITIIGLPLGSQHFKLVGLAFAPFGKRLYREEY